MELSNHSIKIVILVSADAIDEDRSIGKSLYLNKGELTKGG